MSRGSPHVRRIVTVATVATLAVLSSCAAFQLATQDQTAAGQSAGIRTTPSARDQVRQVRQVPAHGQQLWARAPLDNIHQDQGSTVQLPDGRTLWIFADTFQLHDDPKFFISSAAAVSNPGTWQLQYSLSGAITGKRVPAEFMPRSPSELADHKSGDHYQAVWPTGSTQLPDGRIIISYAKYRVLLTTREFTFMGGGLFEYRYRGYPAFRAGDQARRIADNLWTSYDGEVRSPIYAAGFVYFTQCQNLRCYSLRTTPGGLTDKLSYAWWTGSRWSTNSALRQGLAVRTSHPGGNPSIVRLKNGAYAMADTEAGSVSRTAYFWVAPNPWGPWSAAASFTMPECPPPGCYGLNLHPELSTATSLRVSYATTRAGPFVRVDDVPIRMDPGGSWIQAG